MGKKSAIDFFPDQCIFPKSGSPDKDGYSVLGIGRGQSNRAARVVYRLFVGPISDDFVISYTCENKACINPKHLVPRTQTDKNRKTAETMRGEKIHNAKLTPEIVRKIRASNKTHAELAAEYGVNQSAIAKVRYGESWKHVK